MNPQTGKISKTDFVRLLYNIFVALMVFGMKAGALFNYKLKKGLAGRRQSNAIVKQSFSPSDRIIWMHAASLGEYEQGLPVLEKLKKHFPEHKVLITFFSPSGYDHVVRKNHLADAVCYLPLDTESQVAEFAGHFKTDIFFTVKYEYWYNLLRVLHDKGTVIYVVSAFFYEKQLFFKPYGSWFTGQIRKHVNWFFHQTPDSYALARTLRLAQSSISGDTRFDRVKQLRERDHFIPGINGFRGNHKLLVVGSSWEAEERMAQVIAARNKDVKIIIAPHDLKRVDDLKAIFPGALLQSEMEAGHATANQQQILIIDCIGLLSRLYAYADVAVVGGGFHTRGLHNILEAAVFGVPVIFGNHYQKNPEADELIARHGGKSFKDEIAAASFITDLLNDGDLMTEMGAHAATFITEQPNASAVVVARILEDRKSN